MKIKLLSSDSTPVANAIVSAINMWSEEPDKHGVSRAGTTNNNGKVSLDLFDGEWSIKVNSGVPAGEDVFVNILIMPADLLSNETLTIKAHTACSVRGRLEMGGANASTTREILRRGLQTGMAVMVVERLSDSQTEGVASYATLRENGTFTCKLINDRDMLLDINVFFPGDTFSYKFNLGHKVSTGAKTATLRPVIIQKVDDSIVSLKGRIKTGVGRQLKLISAETRGNEDVILLAETFSDKRGSFEIHNLPEGEYILKVYDIEGRDLYSPIIQAKLDIQSGLTTFFRVENSV